VVIHKVLVKSKKIRGMAWSIGKCTEFSNNCAGISYWIKLLLFEMSILASKFKKLANQIGGVIKVP
jgi:hypothetical protein